MISDTTGLDLRCCDCLDLLGSLPDESVSLIVSDPPYYKIVPEAWDHQWVTEDQYLDWCRTWTREYVRVLKPGGCLYAFGTTKTDTFLRYKLEVLNRETDLVYNSWLIWSSDWGGRTKKMFPRKHQDILFYSKGEEFPFRADAVRVP